MTEYEGHSHSQSSFCAEVLGKVSLHQVLLTHTHTPADELWSSRYLLPDDFISATWYMAPANANRVESFLILFVLPSVMRLVSNDPVTQLSAPLTTLTCITTVKTQ